MLLKRLSERPLRENTLSPLMQGSDMGLECYTCGAMMGVQIHHIDWNHANNMSSNKVALCQRCHSTIHGRTGMLTWDELKSIRQQAEIRDPSRFTKHQL